MKTGKLFWGVLLIQIGLLFAFGKYIPVDLGWAALWQIWPISLILIGLLWLVSHKALRAAIAVIAAILLATSIYATIGFRWWGHSSNTKYASPTEDLLTTPFDSTMKVVQFHAGFGAGLFEINGLSDELVSAMTKTTLGTYTINASQTDDHHEVGLEFSGKNDISFKRAKNIVEMKLNPNPLWDIDLDAGASEINLDLSSHKVKRFTLDAGATSLKLKVGDLVPELHVQIDIGASEVRIEIPVSSGCEVKLSSGLTSKRLTDFDEIHDGTYRTPNFEDASTKIYVDIDAGLSSIRVQRY